MPATTLPDRPTPVYFRRPFTTSSTSTGNPSVLPIMVPGMGRSLTTPTTGGRSPACAMSEWVSERGDSRQQRPNRNGTPTEMAHQFSPLGDGLLLFSEHTLPLVP
eukprot:178842_1